MVTGIAVLVGAAVLGWPRDDDVSSGASNDVMPTPLARLIPQATTLGHPQQPPPEQDPPPSEPIETLSRKFDHLVATGRPVDAFAAYQISAECSASRWWQDKKQQLANPAQVYGDFFKHMPPTEIACGDLSPGQIGTRVELLRRAAPAGVHGAYAALGLESPGGILQGLPMNEWIQLSKASFDAGLSTADPVALLERSGQAANCPNLPLCSNPTGDNFAEALMYLIAARESQMRDAGPFRPEHEHALQTAIARYSASLPPEVAASSIARGKALVESAKTP